MFRNERFGLFLNGYSSLTVWLLFFVLSLLIILLVQLILLPYVFSSWHAGDGLLVGGDWIGFHQAALEMAEKITREGWAAWELRPNGWMPAGVAGAIYALTWPKPWALAPINAFVHATTALLVIKLILVFINDRRAALIATLPYALFPSAMLWYTQIHRDGYNILGMLLFIYGFLMIIKPKDKNGKYKWGYIEGKGFLLVLSGILVIWLTRPYAVVIFQFTGILLILLCTLYLVIMVFRQRIRMKDALLKILLLVTIILLIYPFTKSEGAFKFLSEYEVQDEVHNGADAIENSIQKKGVDEYLWVRTPMLPGVVENQLYSIAVLRTILFPISYGETASGIDNDVSLHSAFDYVLYLPRALQIAFFAPFPAEWFKEGSHESTTFFRRISAIEMLFIYFMFIPLIYGVWIWRKKIELYVLLVFCTVMMLPIVYSVPNVGTIYRYRYGYLMLMVSLGVAAFCRYVHNIRGFEKETVKNNRE